jgi:hypothetical protein
MLGIKEYRKSCCRLCGENEKTLTEGVTNLMCEFFGKWCLVLSTTPKAERLTHISPLTAVSKQFLNEEKIFKESSI